MVEWSCIFAAVCFMAGNIMKIIYFVKERQRPFEWNLYIELDPDFIKQDWDFRIKEKGLFMASGFLNAIAWVFFAYIIVHMAWLLSKRGKTGIGVNTPIIMLALGGALTEWLSQLFWMGTNVASTQLFKNYNLDNWVRADVGGVDDGLGWRCLEVDHIIMSGFIWFADIFEWICMFGIFVFSFFSVRKWRREDQTTFGKCWNLLSLFIALLSLLEFSAEILRFVGFQYFGPIAIVYAVINRLLLIPAWILALAFLLPRAEMKLDIIENRDLRDSELALTEMQSITEPTPFPTFVINDENCVEGGDGEEKSEVNANGNGTHKGPASPIMSSPPPEAFSQQSPPSESK